VDAYLAKFTWTRTCTSVGQLRMRKIRYSLGYAWTYQDVSVTFDPQHRLFVFTQMRSKTRKGKDHPKLDPVRRDAKILVGGRYHWSSGGIQAFAISSIDATFVYLSPSVRRHDFLL
jgi:hypothetical protein